MSSAVADLEKTHPRPGQSSGSLAHLLPFGLAIGFSVVLMAAVIFAIFGTAEDRPALAASPGGGRSRTSPAEFPDGEPLRTFAGIPPVAGLVERIGGPWVRVDVLVQAGQDPHIFAPTPRQVLALSRARLVFRVGMPFEDRLVQRISGCAGHFTVVDTAAGIAMRASSHVCTETGNTDDNDDTDEGGQADPHVWLSPPLLKIISANIAAALSRADPRHAHDYNTSLDRLQHELDDLDHRIAQRLAPYRGQAFYVFHPAFGYFADRYGLRQESVEVEGKPPTPREIFGLISKARADRVKIIFLQPQFNQQVAASIAQAIGGAVMPMDSLSLDVAANLDDVAEKIADSNRGRSQ